MRPYLQVDPIIPIIRADLDSLAPAHFLLSGIPVYHLRVDQRLIQIEQDCQFISGGRQFY